MLIFAPVLPSFLQGLAPLVDVPELEKSILCRGGSINYKHFYFPGAQFEASPAVNRGAAGALEELHS